MVVWNPLIKAKRINQRFLFAVPLRIFPPDGLSMYVFSYSCKLLPHDKGYAVRHKNEKRENMEIRKPLIKAKRIDQLFLRYCHE